MALTFGRRITLLLLCVLLLLFVMLLKNWITQTLKTEIWDFTIEKPFYSIDIKCQILADGSLGCCCCFVFCCCCFFVCLMLRVVHDKITLFQVRVKMPVYNLIKRDNSIISESRTWKYQGQLMSLVLSVCAFFTVKTRKIRSSRRF